MKVDNDSTKFVAIIEYFDRRKDDHVPDDAPREIIVDIDVPQHKGGFGTHPMRSAILKRTVVLIKERCDIAIIRAVHIRWPHTRAVAVLNFPLECWLEKDAV